MRFLAIFALALLPLCWLPGQQNPTKKGGGFQLPTVDPSAEERRKIQEKCAEIEKIVAALRLKGVDESLIADVDIYAKAGRWPLAFPGFFAQQEIDNALTVLDRGLERAHQLEKGQSPWVAQRGRKIHAFYSSLDGSVQPYGLTVPESYDGSHPVRLYVWLHGRNARLTESNFIYSFPQPVAATSTAYTADTGQIQVDVYGRGNNANHWPGEVDIFEAIDAVKQRYKIDGRRILLRGFSLGGAAAWHIALHYPDRFVAAEIGAGTWPRRSQMPGFPPYQAGPLHIWENIIDWSLNAYNIPIAGHDGDSDTGVSSIPPPPAGTPSRGQLESSIRVREQLAKEGFPSEGEPNSLVPKGTRSIFLISEKTGHGVSPVVKKRLDAFLKEWGDQGQASPDHIRFLTYTTRYNKSYWASLDGLEKHYKRAEIDAKREPGGALYEVTTKNLTRITLRETELAKRIRIDGQELTVKSAPSVTLEKAGSAWRVARPGKWAGLHKTHALQGPVDDAFLEPYLLVTPTGTPWNETANKQSLKLLERFDRAYARNYRAHPRVKKDTEVTEADFQKFNVALFGDPGSNRWIARIQPKLPMRWTRDAINLGKQSFAASGHVPVMIYPNPLNPSRYVVINSGLTIEEREYNSDYSMPRLGDFAVLKIKDGSEFPQIAYAGLFDESWRLPPE